MLAMPSEVRDFFHHHHDFVVLSHVRPDGDAYGSTLGLGLMLATLGKRVACYNEDGLSPRYQFLPGSSHLQKTPVIPPPAETKIISVDTSTQERLGETFQKWNRVVDLNIDHHVSNPGFGGINYVDANVPATAQALYEIFAELGFSMNADIAANLYVGISTDTGSFRYRQTTAQTLHAAAHLIEVGADPAALAQKCYSNYSLARFLLLKEILNDVELLDRGKIAFYHLTPEMYQRTGANSDETEGMLEYLQMTETVEVAFMLEVVSPQVTRVSLRSRGKVDVNQIAGKFGGGGHRLAAGIKSSMPIKELEQQLLLQIRAQLQA